MTGSPREFYWANNNRLVLIIKKNYKPTGYDKVETWYRMLAIGADGSNPVVLMADQPGFRYNTSSATIIGRDMNDPDHVYTELYVPHMTVQSGSGRLENKEDQKVFRLDLLKVDINTGAAETMARGTPETWNWIVDNHGNIIGRIDQSVRPLKDHLYLNRSGTFDEVGVFDASGLKGLDVQGLTADGTGLVIKRRSDQSTYELARLD